MIEIFRDIITNFKNEKETMEFVESPLVERFNNEYKDNLKELVWEIVDDPQSYYIDTMDIVQWPNSLRLNIGNHNAVYKFQSGLYVIYDFFDDGSEVYLSINQGSQFPSRRDRIDIANKLYNSIDLSNLNGFNRDFPETVLYNEDAIIGKRYSLEDLDEEILKDDLNNILKVYESIIPNYIEIIKDKKLELLIEEINKGENYPKISLEDEGDDGGEEVIEGGNTPTGSVSKSILPNFLYFLKQKNLFFDIKTIENYLLSLKVKPFVILTGPSGTGKTKIAQKFAEYQWGNEYTTVKTQYSKIETNEENGDYFFLGKGTVSQLLNLSKYDGTVDLYFDDFKSNESLSLDIRATCDDKKVLEHLKTIDDLSNVKIQILNRDLVNTFSNEKFEKETILSFEPNIGKSPEWCIPSELLINFLPIKNDKCKWNAIIDGIKTTITFWVHTVNFKLSPPTNEEVMEHIKQKGEKDKLKIEVDLESFKFNDNNLYEGVEIEGDFRIPENYKIIPVGANWTDNRNIFGFYNVITKKYQTTPSLDLILKTKENIGPHFLILDEMNLSHVERYFADFLSAIESKELIPLYSENNISEELNVPPKLPIPENLFVIGTVNVDETTYMFSPKVLDRANVLEFESFSKDFTIADFMCVEGTNNFFNQKVNFEKISYLEDPLKDSDILKQPIDKLRDKLSKIDIKIPNEEGKEKTVSLWVGLSEQLESINKILKPSGFDLGFRAVKEILSFMYVAYVYESFDSDGADWEFDWERYLDAQIKQKMLPKIHGSKKVLGNTLNELLAICLGCNIDNLDERLKSLKDEEGPNKYNFNSENTNYPSSAKKIAEMREVLENQRYVSYIN